MYIFVCLLIYYCYYCVGRWQKGKDLFWYEGTKKSSSNNSNEQLLINEKLRMREDEENRRLEALGLKTKQIRR